jgi:hypothetical protein
MCQATLERAGDEEEDGFSSKVWWEVLQFGDEWNGLISAISHASGVVTIGTDRGAGSNESVIGMLDNKDSRWLLGGHVRRGGGDFVDSALEREGGGFDHGAVLHKHVEGFGDTACLGFLRYVSAA